MLRRERHVGEHVGLGLVEEAGELGQLGTELVGDLPPLRPGRLGIVLANAVAMKAEMTRRPLLPACASALRARNYCAKVLSFWNMRNRHANWIMPRRTRALPERVRSPRNQPRKERLSSSLSRRSVLARRCSRDTATLDA
jgi:hypothetical protein